MLEPVLKVDMINKSYTSVRAVKDVSFTLERGDIFAFLGPNGAGKTTTLRILLDIIKADSGLIEWNISGRKSKSPSVSDIGYLPEERGLYTDVQVIKSLVYMATIRGSNPKEARKSAYEWLEKFDLADRGKEKLQVLSKGNQQKIQFIASILHKPKFVILDEPFSGMDPINQEKFIEYIRDLNASGATILLSSHQMQLVEKIANKIFLINDGQELYNGKLEDIYYQYQGQLSLELKFKDQINKEDLLRISDVLRLDLIRPNTCRVLFSEFVKLPSILEKLSNFKNISSIKSYSMNLHDIFVKLIKEKR